MNKNINYKIESKKERFLKDLSLSDLKGYIDSVITSYFNSYIKGNSIELKEDISEINAIIELFDEEFSIKHYINYRLMVIGNKALETILNKSESCLFYPSEVDIDFNVKEKLIQELFDENKMLEIVAETQMYNIHEFIGLMQSLPYPKTPIPRVMVKEIQEFVADIKKGKYDNSFIIEDQYLTDKDSYENIKKKEGIKIRSDTLLLTINNYFLN